MRKRLRGIIISKRWPGKYHVGLRRTAKAGGQHGRTEKVWPNRLKAPEEAGERKKEDGILKSQKILLTWLIGGTQDLSIRSAAISSRRIFPGRSTGRWQELLYQQYEERGDQSGQDHESFYRGRGAPGGSLPVPHEDPGADHRPEEREKALKETVVRMKNHSIEEAAAHLDPTDIRGLQRLMEAKKAAAGP